MVLTLPLILKILAILILIGATLYIHYRGKARYPFLRQMFDHSTFMAPINTMMYAFSSVPKTPYLPVKTIPALQQIKDNWETIKQEALTLESSKLIKGSDKYNDIGFNSFFRRGWKRFYLKWYNNFHPSALEHCPETIKLLRSMPDIKAAMFVVLPAGSYLPVHRDPYAGSLRYHLGLITPNSDDCKIVVDGEAYSWRDGEDVLFDETYIHYAENKTDKDRLIFFCDVARPMRSRVGVYLNNFFSWLILASAESPNLPTDRTGGLNKIFGYVYHIRIVGKKLKERNKTLYYISKYAIFIAVAYLIFFL
jgi:beta-hydroxylase